MKRMIAIVAVLTFALSLGAAESHPFSAHDMWAMKRISDPALSPDGTNVVFTLRTNDMEANKGLYDLWVVRQDGTGLRQLTTHPARDNAPLWSPDGSAIYFLSNRSGSNQVWKLPFGGGEAKQMTWLPLDLDNLLVSPDGKALAFSAEVFPGLSMDQTVEKLEARAAKKASGVVFDKVFVRHWDTWKDGRRNHVFVMTIEDGSVVDVMKSMDADSPSKPFGGREEVAFTPDSRSIVFTARDAGREEPWSTNFDLWLSPIDGSAVPRNLTADNEAWDTQPVFSPDGRTMAWLAMKRPGYEADRFQIKLKSWPDGKVRELAADWDRSPAGIGWTPDSKSVLASAGNLGQTSLFAIDVSSGKVRTLVREGTVGAFDTSPSRVVYGLDHLTSPVELYTVGYDGKDIKQITTINKPLLDAARMGAAEQFTFKGWNDETVYAWVVRPVDFDASKKYPVAFLIHGGPQGSFDNHFHYRWNPQAYAGAGYAAVFVDFHGSTGYGQDFSDAIRGDWGGKPLEDLQKGLAAAIEKYPWMDGDRVAALGASYGGYMINWIASQWPDRFRALVCHDGNLDERMAYFDTEELWFPEWDHEGTPWTNPEGYAKHNPVNHVDKWKTPMLVIHGALDYRVVDTQGIATFNLLQRRGIPSRFLYFPDENHWVLSPANGILWHEEVLAWIDKWTKE